MPKRLLDISGDSAMSSEKRVQKKSERSHEENQERAYIAASRRADRSVEARVQSARMASEIHKKRTGKGFKISEEIVMKEEMYEEEDDDLPRHYRMLAHNMHTSSADMNHRLNAYLTNRVAMASLAHQANINRMFAEEFPNVPQVSQQLSQSVYLQDFNQPSKPPPPPQFSPAPTYHPGPMPYQRDRSQSMPQTTPIPSRPQAATRLAQQIPHTRHASIDDNDSSPALTPGSLSATTSQSTPTFSHTEVEPSMERRPSSGLPVDPSLDHHAPMMTSSFTSELSPQTRMMTSFDMNNPLGPFLYHGGGELSGTEIYNFQHGNMTNICTEPYMDKEFQLPSVEPQDHIKSETPDFFSLPHNTARSYPLSGEESRIGTPGGGQGDFWDTFMEPEARWGQQ
ncbi:hypothetical protein B0H63DRAFT_178542 [Podospora didyma]|uniref:Uncharacterized protein n=1 Tax=Podospora didyma TaxID=330526 RepID=A0AAE0NP15_9PEZI|nr:hypothetical protein B0H63DRAFT_178542 [Podospora didyma]